MRTSLEWQKYYEENVLSLLEIPWNVGHELTDEEQRAIASSVQDFQGCWHNVFYFGEPALLYEYFIIRYLESVAVVFENFGSLTGENSTMPSKSHKS